jgi:DNA-directed RNA polymerase sigma subunit (sigma70/sigma32)
MPRPWSQTFNCPPLEDLLRQLAFAPADKRAQQVRAIERLHDEIDPDATYPLSYLVYRITRYRRDLPDAETLLVGEAAQPDLRLMIDRLSRETEMTLSPGESAETPEQLAQRLDVSTKTVTRWRRDGLRWRWLTRRPGGRKEVVILRDAADRYLRRNAERVAKASAFSQIPDEQRDRLVRRARRLADAGDLTLNQVAQHLSRRTGRALETVRQILQKHDARHPEDPIFADRDRPLTPQQRRVIARAYRMGVPVTRLARRFDRTRATIYRAIHERRAAAARRLPLRWQHLPTFDRADADTVILGRPLEPHPPNGPRKLSTIPVEDLPGPLQPLYRQPVIPDDRQHAMLVRYNYLKCHAARIRDALDRSAPRVADLDHFTTAVEQAREIRDLLVRANLPVVLSVARRHLMGRDDRSRARLIELLAAGNVAAIEAVDDFDPARNQTFPRYLTNVLLRQYAALDSRSAPSRPRAHRRLTAEQALQRLIDQAGESGVHLLQEQEDRE